MFFYPLKYLFFLSFFYLNTKGIKITTEKLLKENYLFGARSYNNLIERIDTHKVSKIYISPFLNEVLSENEEFTGNEYVDYSLTKVSPLVVNAITEEAVKNKVETIFLQSPQPNLFQQLSSELNYVTGFLGPLFFLLFLSSIVRSVFFNGGQSGMPNMGNMGNFPGTLGGNRVNKDKKTIEKFNITLSSFAGSQEILEECTEVVSYLKNSTIYKLA
jgi:ATP-dependent Zn protease